MVLVSAFGPELHRVRTILIVEDLANGDRQQWTFEAQEASFVPSGGVDEPDSVRFYSDDTSGGLQLQVTTAVGVRTAILDMLTTGAAPRTCKWARFRSPRCSRAYGSAPWRA